MGYHERLITSTCRGCKEKYLWRRQAEDRAFRRWVCRNCKGENTVSSLPDWPEVPRSIYIGTDNNHLLKLFPVPPEQSDERWATPYSVRSVLYQASRAFGGCNYSCTVRGKIYDEIIFFDKCSDPEDPLFDPDQWDCHILAGWSAGKTTCTLFESLARLCQTDVERKFLSTYLRYVKDRDFPMLIPQMRLGIAERRRPDFVLYVPLQYWKFKWLVVELDGAHPEEKAQDDAARDHYYNENGYETISLRPGAKGYFEEVRVLAEKIDVLMQLSQTDTWDVAIDARVSHFESSEELPF